MARPIWTGAISFGLLNIPIRLMAGERRTDLSFHMLDSRDNAAIRYERVNAETGEEVPWKEIVKAYEYSKDSYVVLQPEDLERAASENDETIALDSFVRQEDIPPAYLEKPYILVPGKKAEKGYVLLREVLRRSGRVGVGRVMIRTREYLSMVTVQGDALMLILLRFPQELVDAADYDIPAENAKAAGVNERELKMAQALLESMTAEWDPSQYRDEFRARLHEVIRQRIETQTGVAHVAEEEEEEEAPEATNVVDFMALLQQSLDRKGGKPPQAPAKKAARARKSTRKAAGKTAAKKKA